MQSADARSTVRQPRLLITGFAVLRRKSIVSTPTGVAIRRSSLRMQRCRFEGTRSEVLSWSWLQGFTANGAVCCRGRKHGAQGHAPCSTTDSPTSCPGCGAPFDAIGALRPKPLLDIGQRSWLTGTSRRYGVAFSRVTRARMKTLRLRNAKLVSSQFCTRGWPRSSFPIACAKRQSRSRTSSVGRGASVAHRVRAASGTESPQCSTALRSGLAGGTT